MTLEFRNIDVDPSSPVEEWGFEGLLAAIDRGEASDWSRIAAELVELIRTSGLTLEQFAKRLGTSRPRLSTYVSGTVVPAATTLVRARRIAEFAPSIKCT